MAISPRNKRILSFDDDHPAKRFLIEHGRFMCECVGFEVAYPNRPAIMDIKWESDCVGEAISLSSVLYKYISFTPVLHGWIDLRRDVSELSDWQLEKIDLCRQLLQESIEAARIVNAPEPESIAERALVVLEWWELSIRLHRQLKDQEA